MKNLMVNKANELINLERKFNQENTIEKIPIGSLLTDYWLEEYQKANGKEIKPVSTINLILSIIKFILKALVKKNINNEKFKDAKILFGKSGRYPHHNFLVNPLAQKFSTPFILESGADGLFHYINFSKRVLIISQGIFLFFKILSTLSIKDLTSKTKLYYYLIINLIRFQLLKDIIKDSKINHVVVDYDRAKFTPLVLAAKSIGIPTFTLQHGVINPPYGYVPVLADRIFVWGSLWQDILLEMGTDINKIEIVGSSYPEGKKKTKQAYTEELRTIGIGPNPVGFTKNKQLWGPIISRLIQLGYNVVVKLHPSMNNYSDIHLIFGNSCTIKKSTEMNNYDFFDQIDLLLVSTSGLGYEAVEYGVPVAIVRESNDSFGNDHIMVHYGKFPTIEINNIQPILENIESNFSSILSMEQEFIKSQVYISKGTETHQLIVKIIKDRAN